MDDKGKPIISPITFGYNTEIKDQYAGIINATVLYNIYKVLEQTEDYVTCRFLKIFDQIEQLSKFGYFGSARQIATQPNAIQNLKELFGG